MCKAPILCKSHPWYPPDIQITVILEGGGIWVVLICTYFAHILDFSRFAHICAYFAHIFQILGGWVKFSNTRKEKTWRRRRRGKFFWLPEGLKDWTRFGPLSSGFGQISQNLSLFWDFDNFSDFFMGKNRDFVAYQHIFPTILGIFLWKYVYFDASWVPENG